MADIVSRLRKAAADFMVDTPLLDEAADEIEKVRELYVGALREIKKLNAKVAVLEVQLKPMRMETLRNAKPDT